MLGRRLICISTVFIDQLATNRHKKHKEYSQVMCWYPLARLFLLLLFFVPFVPFCGPVSFAFAARPISPCCNHVCAAVLMKYPLARTKTQGLRLSIRQSLFSTSARRLD